MELRDGRLKDENDGLDVHGPRNVWLLAKDYNMAAWGAASDAWKIVSAPLAFLPFVKCVSPASVFQHQGQYTVPLITDFFSRHCFGKIKGVVITRDG
jgi:hypothetical protein